MSHGRRGKTHRMLLAGDRKTSDSVVGARDTPRVEHGRGNCAKTGEWEGRSHASREGQPKALPKGRIGKDIQGRVLHTDSQLRERLSRPVEGCRRTRRFRVCNKQRGTYSGLLGVSTKASATSLGEYGRGRKAKKLFFAPHW